MSALRKSIDLQSVKTRHIVVQNEDGSFPPAYALLAADEKGRGVTEWTQDISVNSINVVNATIQHADISSAVIDYLPQFDLSGNIYSIVPSYATLPQLIASYNQLITLFANRTIFLSLSTIPVLLFQTHCEIHIAEFISSSPNTRIDFTYSQPIHLGVATGSIVATLNQSAINAGAKLRFSLDAATSQISYQEASGYSWIFTDPEHYGSANRFLNHLGIRGLIPSEKGAFVVYNSGIGSVIANPTGGSPVTPAAPGALDLSGSATPHGFTINIPAADPVVVKKVGIFLDHSTGSIHSWNIISYPATSYTFSNLVPETAYLVHLTFLSDYDESNLSPALPVRTPSMPVQQSFNVLTAAETLLTPPPLNAVYNNRFFVVAHTTAAVWSKMPGLNRVSQISSIELQYYSGFNEAPRNYNGSYNIQDARFSFYSYPSSPYEPPVNDDGGVVLYYSGASRMAVTGPGNERYAIGSSNPPNTSTTPPSPAASVFISDKNTLKYIFGQGTIIIDRTDFIDTTRGFQFAWFCGYGGSLIQNMNISKFIINYTVYYN